MKIIEEDEEDEERSQEKEVKVADYFKCFSLIKSYSALTASRERPDEDPELRLFEGIRVISMWYGIFCCMNLYILVPAITNIQYMIELFKDPF